MSKELPINEWVIIFYPQTGSTRLCPTYDAALEMVSTRSAVKNIYKKPDDFRRLHDHHSLEKFWVSAYKSAAFYLPKSATGTLERYSETPPDVKTEEFVQLFWKMLQDIGDRVKAPQQTQLTREHYELKLQSMKDLVEDLDAYEKKYNKQARTIFSALIYENKQFMLEDEIKQIILDLVVRRELKTKQDPWVVFQYYRPQFIKDGYMLRAGSNFVKQNKPH